MAMTPKQKALAFEAVAGAAFTGAGVLIYMPLGLLVLGCVALLAAWTITSSRS